MPKTLKIAVCCYCGGRQTLVLERRRSTSLKCESCAAPLSKMKAVKVATAEPSQPKRGRKPAKRRGPAARRGPAERRVKRCAPPRRPLSQRLGHWLEEALDEIEDLFD